MNYFLPYAQSFRQDFRYLIGTEGRFTERASSDAAALPTGVVKGIVIVADDGACISEQMQPRALEKAFHDDSFLIAKAWVNKYRVYLIHQQLDDSLTLYYRDLSETLNLLEIPFIRDKYRD